MMVCDESVTGNIRPSLSVFSFTPCGGEPRHGIARLKLLEGRKQRLFAAGKSGGEFAFVKTGVGDIAPAAAGNFDFGKKLRCFFEDENFRAAFSFCARQRGKKSGCAAADNPDALRVH